jgi:hypothetical protein
MLDVRFNVGNVGMSQSLCQVGPTDTRLKAMENVAKFGWTVLPHPLYSPDLVLSDFNLFGPMTDGLWGQRFPGIKASMRAAAGSCSSLARMHSQWWWLCGTIVFCSWKLALSKGVIVHPLYIVVSMEIKMRHYLWSTMTSFQDPILGATGT